MAKYDDASWHYGGDFPKDLPEDRACTHIGMFLGWAIDSGLEGDLLKEEFPGPLESFRKRMITGTQVLRTCCDDKLTNDDLNDEGNAFASEYYENNTYFKDYTDVLKDGLPSIYHVVDSWENYQLIRNRLNDRFAQWKTSGG